MNQLNLHRSLRPDDRQSWQSNRTDHSWSDWMGVTASVACAIHCAAMPFAVAFLPMLGLSFLADESFHKVMVVVCSLLAAAAFVPGLKRHRSLLPIGVAAIGLAMIATAAFALEGDCCAAGNTNRTLLAGSGSAEHELARDNPTSPLAFRPLG